MKLFALLAPVAVVLLAGPGAQGTAILRGAGGHDPAALQEKVAEVEAGSTPTQWWAVLSHAKQVAMSKLKLLQVASVLSHLRGRSPEYTTEPHLASTSTAMQREQWEREQRVTEWTIGISWLVTSAIWLFLGYLAAKYWRDSARDASYTDAARGVAGEDFTDFRAGICECYQRPDVCVWVFCCPAVRWAENVWTMGLFRCFWFAFVLFAVVGFIGGATQEDDGSLGLLERMILMGVIGAGFRQELRQKFQMTERGGMTYFKDCLLYSCCMCCTVIQEARMIEDAVRKGHPAVVHKVGASKAKEAPTA